jgi:NAD+ diphosphatase
MIQDIGSGLFHNEFEHPEPQAGDWVFSFENRTVLLREGNQGIEVPTVRELPPDKQTTTSLRFLFRVSGKACYLWYENEPLTVASYSYGKLRLLRSAHPQDVCFAGETAYQLYGWYRDNHFCGRCGKPMHPDTVERAMKCDACGHIVYPKIMPAVIVGVLWDNKILTTRYAGREFKGRALIAGFCEIGETGEDTVRREVMEEVGLRVKNIRYFASQPWGFESDLLIGYTCEVDGNPTIHVDHHELAIGEWMTREALQLEELHTISLTATILDAFRKGKL